MPSSPHNTVCCATMAAWTNDLNLDWDGALPPSGAPAKKTAFKKKVYKGSSSRRMEKAQDLLEEQVLNAAIGDEIVARPQNEPVRSESPDRVIADEPMPDLIASPGHYIQKGAFLNTVPNTHDYELFSKISIRQQASQLVEEYADKYNYDDGAHGMFGSNLNHTQHNDHDDSHMPEIDVVDDATPFHKFPWNPEQYDFELNTDEEEPRGVDDVGGETVSKPAIVRTRPIEPVSSVLERLYESRANLATKVAAYADQLAINLKRLQELAQKLANLSKDAFE